MVRASVLIILLVAGLAAPAWAQSPTQSPMQSPMQESSSCADQVKKLQNSPELGVQGGTSRQETGRAEAQTFLTEAAQAAAHNDEKTCREKLQAAQLSLTY
ncbi:MAG TPA: hypothetical protein VGB82_27625 [Alphaproteobacteria bacterium]